MSVAEVTLPDEASWLAAHAAGRLNTHIRDQVAAFAPHPPERTRLKEAAVTVIVTVNDSGEPVFVLTQRASKMRNHPGQWALPGGRIDPGEDAPTAARREIEEEVGLTVDRADLFGPLDAYVTRSGYAITPFVAWADPGATFTLNPAEVQALHLVPLRDLDRPDSPQFVDIPESDRPVIRMPIMDKHIHAPTAAVLYQFREVALHGRATRVAHLEQPVFAWK